MIVNQGNPETNVKRTVHTSNTARTVSRPADAPRGAILCPGCASVPPVSLGNTVNLLVLLDHMAKTANLVASVL